MSLPPFEPSARVSRRDLALNRSVWLTIVGVFAFVAACTAGIAVLWPSFGAGRPLPFAAALMLVVVVGALVKPPTIDDAANHLVILLPPVFTSIGVVAFAPHGVVPVAAAMFAGAVAASRLQSRRALFFHYGLATAIVAAPLFLVTLDDTARLALISVIPAMLGLGLCTSMVLEAGEAQGAELQRLVRSDRLTGVGNGRLLAERFEWEIARHHRIRQPFAVLTIDIDGLATTNDLLGTSTGDALLQAVAAAIEGITGPHDTLVRRGDDEFCLLLPRTARERAEEVRGEIADALAAITLTGRPVTGSSGVAIYPSDATTSDLLVEVADTRLSLHKSDRHAPVSELLVWTPTTGPAAPAVIGETEPRLDTVAGLWRVSRADITTNRAVWLATGGLYAFYSGLAIIACTFAGWPGLHSVVFCLGLMLVAAAILVSEPPALGSRLNHVVLALPYVGLGVAELMVPEVSGLLLGGFMFTGPLVAARLTDRREVVAHCALATLVVFALIASGTVGVPMALALLLACSVVWVLAATDLVYFEAAEEQCDELERIVRRDPLTGLGNWRRLAEVLDRQVARSARSGKHVTLVAVDLRGFADFAQARGSDATDELVQDAAAALTEIAGERGHVFRQRSDEFWVLLPDTSAERAVPLINAMKVAVSRLGTETTPLRAGLGIASVPVDAKDADVALHVASWRLRDDQRGADAPGGRRASDATSETADPMPAQRILGTGTGPLQVFD